MSPPGTRPPARRKPRSSPSRTERARKFRESNESGTAKTDKRGARSTAARKVGKQAGKPSTKTETKGKARSATAKPSAAPRAPRPGPKLAATERVSGAPAGTGAILSAQNPSYKLWRSLLTGRGVRKHQRALIAGAKVVAEVVADFGDLVEACLMPDGSDPPPGLPPEMPCHRLVPKLIRDLDPGESGPPLLVVRVPEMPPWAPAQGSAPEGCTLFIPFQDPVNVGAALRSAAGFGVHRVVMLKESAHPFHPRSLQAAGSAVFRSPLMRGPALAELNTEELPCFTLDLHGEPLRSFRFPERFGLVPGLEGTGMPDLAGPSIRIHIPMAPGVESLNAATATAIALYHWRIHIADMGT